MIISPIVEIILCISALIVAIRNIYGFIKQPKKVMDDYQKKQRDELMVTIKTVIREEIQGLQDSMEYHKKTLRLVLATQIERIYWNGFADKTLYLYNQEPLHTLYEAYHSLGGNGHIDRLMAQMSTWTLIDNAAKS